MENTKNIHDWAVVSTSQIHSMASLQKRLQGIQSLIPSDRILIVVNEKKNFHEIIQSLGDFPIANILVQPCSKGSSPEILLALTEILRRDRRAQVFICEGNSMIRDEAIFQETLRRSFEQLERSPNQVLIWKKDAESLKRSLALTASASTLMLAFGLAEPYLLRRFFYRIQGPAFDSKSLSELYSSIPKRSFMNAFWKSASAYIKIFEISDWTAEEIVEDGQPVDFEEDQTWLPAEYYSDILPEGRSEYWH